ncbi:class I SAM-dependent methyltransferase [Pseudorhodoferax sp. Leaf267]|uniref:class I SAM-dependent methyltransferase n=1 Tax=Pseudorhodoferax sp. Leaf267 TaxID=1736316 RepID=UPI0006FC1558|nr:class I SAM-dependent methyltransferase [Pseudorhodoferax sp. Leaf267]KQP11848.1 methyltransferase type 11 [Pseudorhodoferax sp. Leaf267]
MTTTAWTTLLDTACAPYRAAGMFAWRFARGKLGMDPVFRYLIEQGHIRPGARVLDIGCGQGLLASLLASSGQLARQGQWPAAWPPAPAPERVTGIELMPRDVERARAALAQLGDTAQFVCGDMRTTAFPAVDAVVILDVLHYIGIDEQNQVLARVRAALPPGGLLLLRVGDASARRGFAISQWVDAVVTRIRGHRVLPQYGRTLAQWSAQLQQLGFDVQSQPMSAGTPFANVLLIAKVTP